MSCDVPCEMAKQLVSVGDQELVGQCGPMLVIIAVDLIRILETFKGRTWQHQREAGLIIIIIKLYLNTIKSGTAAPFKGVYIH